MSSTVKEACQRLAEGEMDPPGILFDWRNT